MQNQFAIMVHSGPTRPGRSVRPPLFSSAWWGRFLPHWFSAPSTVNSPFGQAVGILIVLNCNSRQLQLLSDDKLLKKTIRAGKNASRLGASIIGLGQPLSKALGAAVMVVARSLKATVTSGAGSAVVAAIEGIWKAAGLMEINLEESSVLIMGATEPLGDACTQILARDGINYFTLVDSDRFRLDRLAGRLLYDCGVACKISSRVDRAVAQADLIVAAGGEALTRLRPSSIKPGAIVCNLSVVEKLTENIVNSRPDVMVFDQSILRLPGGAGCNEGFSFSGAEIPAPMAEAILLALEGRPDRYFLGPRPRLEKLIAIRSLLRKHGFKLSGFAALNRHFGFAEIETIKDHRPA